MSKKKDLFVCYCRPNYSHESEYKPVFCYGFSPRHAMNLAIRFCVERWHWEPDSFEVCSPILITSFAR